jgi:tetratricopeptide (TPR) repeat protein
MASEAPYKYETESAILIHNRARLHVKRQQVPEAIADLTALLQHQPGNADAYFDRGVLHQRSGQRHEALRDFDAAIKWSPSNPEAHFNRAQTLVSLGRVNESLVDYERVLTLVPDHLEALIDRARLFQARKDLDAARTDVNAALLLSPANARLLCLHGLLDLEDGSLAQAYESFTKAIEADASLPDAWANRATVFFQQGDLDRACLDLTQALALRADSAAFYNRGRCFEQKKRWIEAIEDYSHALELANGDARDIQHHLDVCRRAGGHRN